MARHNIRRNSSTYLHTSIQHINYKLMKKRDKKNLFYVFLIVVLIIIAVFVSKDDWNQEDNDQQTIKIGVIGPMSGVLARFGEWTLRGALIGAEEINNSGGIGGKKIELITEDDECSGVNAVGIVNKLQDIENVDIIVSFCTITSSAIAPVTKGKSLVLAPTFKLTQLVEADFPHYIAMQPSMIFEVTELFKYIIDNGYKSISILYTTNDFWSAYKDAVVELSNENNIEITTIEEADFLANDFRTQLAKIKSSNPDVIFGRSKPGPFR